MMYSIVHVHFIDNVQCFDVLYILYKNIFKRMKIIQNRACSWATSVDVPLKVINMMARWRKLNQRKLFIEITDFKYPDI